LINTQATSSSYYALDVQGGGTSRLYVRADGNIGIGTTTPSYKLDVASGGGTTARIGTDSNDTLVVGDGLGKITVGTVDPVYNIDGMKYATYMAGMIGVKEEVTGVVTMQRQPEGKNYCQYIIDFDELEEGSDLWLFAKTTNLRNNIHKMSVLLTPAGNTQAWYQVNPEEYKLIFYSNQPTVLSYRLTASRFDWEKWSNLAKDADAITGFVIESEDNGESSSKLSVYSFDESRNQGEDFLKYKENNKLTVTQDKKGKIIPQDAFALKPNLAQLGLTINEYGELELKTLKTEKLCIGNVCVTEDEFRNVFDGGVGFDGAGDSSASSGQATSTDPADDTADLDETPDGSHGAGDPDDGYKQATTTLPATTTPPTTTTSPATSTDTGTSTDPVATSTDSADNSEPVCDADNLGLCETENQCQEAGLYWHGGECYLEKQSCESDWDCTDWEPEITDEHCEQTITQTRECTDLNECGIDDGKPNETQEVEGPECAPLEDEVVEGDGDANDGNDDGSKNDGGEE
jgi:hypothetical protein